MTYDIRTAANGLLFDFYVSTGPKEDQHIAEAALARAYEAGIAEGKRLGVLSTTRNIAED